MRSRDLASAVVLLALAACSPLGTAADPDLIELVERIPDQAPVVVTIDVDATREVLELANDAGVDDPDASADDPQLRRLLGVMAVGLPYLAQPEEIPLQAAVDTGAISFIASSPAFGRNVALVVFSTSQPFEDIAAELERAGYRQEGDLLVTTDSPREVQYPVVANDGELVLLAQSTNVAESALEADGEDAGHPASELLEAAEGPVRGAAVADGDDVTSCLGGLGVADEVEPTTGELLIGAGESPQRTRFLPGLDEQGPFDRLDLGDPDPDGRLLRVPFTYEGGPDLLTPLTVLTSDVPLQSLYDCP